MKPQIHLLCNAHLDPVWLWEWQEGAAEAISTFRAAADLCEEFDGFVFNHNEAVLYEWVREYEPALFARIQQLVRQGRWHIMGGWYLQPDCNMPSGESLVRQIERGRRFFRDHFNARPTTAINFDPFGHSRGLVQIMTKAGYDSYIICRPTAKEMPLEGPMFKWVGFDGSELTVCRPHLWYNSPLGKAADKVHQQIKERPEDPCALLLWGVGNHGGGPSRKDMRDLRALMRRTGDVRLIHSTAEAFFAEEKRVRGDAALPRLERDLNPWGVGCYTSQCRIKQSHRRLENELFGTEKMLTLAAAKGLLTYPTAELDQAERDLLFGEFHDILPGSSIEPVERASLRLFDHGLEILSCLKMRAFIALSSGQAKARPGRIPILVCNPHPYPVRAQVACEFQLPDFNHSKSWTLPRVFHGTRGLPSQVEKELSNLDIDWRKRVIFEADLAPGGMSRFDVRLEMIPGKPQLPRMKDRSKIVHRTDDLKVCINTRTGLIDLCRAHGRDVLAKGAARALVIDDNEDSWGMAVRSFRKIIGRFKPMAAAEAAAFAGVQASGLEPVRIIEDGAVRTVVEALMVYGRSTLVCRYELPKRGTKIGIEWRVSWQQPNTMLKLSLPTVCGKGARYLGQTAFGVHELPINGDECVAQKWVAGVDDAEDLAVTLINDGVYGSDFKDGEIRVSLLRSAGYSAHPIGDRPLVPQDRHSPRIDIGQRLFRFELGAGGVRERLDVIDREALALNERPMALSFFPSGQGVHPGDGPALGDSIVQCSALQWRDGALQIRLFNPTDRARATTLRWRGVIDPVPVRLAAWEFATLRLPIRKSPEKSKPMR